MNKSELLGLGACAEVISGCCFPGFTLKKGVSLSPLVVGLGPFLVLVDLFTGLVAPTTCSLLLVLYYLFSDTLSAGTWAF